MHVFFFLRHYNDIDHISPIIYQCLERGDQATAILLDRNSGADDDPRLAMLKQYDRFTCRWVDEFLDVQWARPGFELGDGDGRTPKRTSLKYIRLALRKSGLSVRYSAKLLDRHDPDACVFEWGPPYRMSHAEFFYAAKSLGVSSICVPHGLNIYTNIDIKPFRARAAAEGMTPQTRMNAYDAYVTQSVHDRDQEVTFGLDPEICHVLGSTRYYPPWQSINESLHGTFEPEGMADGRLGVVFMLPHWEYNVDRERTLGLIERLAAADWTYLAVKEHTRGDSLPPDLDATLVHSERAEVLADVPSVSLIKWADAVINFGSSIGIEAFLQETHHVNPGYLHTNTTVFDETGAGNNPDSNDETIDVLRSITTGTREPASEAEKAPLYRRVIYGGRDPFDVLEAYRDLIRRYAQASD